MALQEKKQEVRKKDYRRSSQGGQKPLNKRRFEAQGREAEQTVIDIMVACDAIDRIAQVPKKKGKSNQKTEDEPQG